MNRNIHRSWRTTRLGAVVFTGPHAAYRRGTIDARRHQNADSRTTWSVHDFDGYPLPDVTGDYLDAEAALLTATSELDELDAAADLPQTTLEPSIASVIDIL